MDGIALLLKAKHTAWELLSNSILSMAVQVALFLGQPLLVSSDLAVAPLLLKCLFPLKPKWFETRLFEGLHIQPLKLATDPFIADPQSRLNFTAVKHHLME